ncbi:MAG: CPBP family intramembrane metalloprotease [Bacteroidetes bacterium]|nr:CPBP family intramembrane metalloprotease [Bacteroidota bacterium]
MNRFLSVFADVLIGGIVFAEFFIFSIFSGLLNNGHPALKIVLLLAYILAVVLTVRYLLQRIGNISFRQIGFNFKGFFKNTLHGFSLAVIFIAAIFLLSEMIYGNKFQFEHQLNKNELLSAAVSCLFIGLWEELLFRGYIMVILLKNKVNVFLSIVISSALFGSIHSFGMDAYDSPLFPLSVMGIGCIIGIIYLSSGSLVIPIVFHWVWDILATILFRKEIGIIVIPDILVFNHVFQNLILVFILLMIPVMLLFYRKKNLVIQLENEGSKTEQAETATV